MPLTLSTRYPDGLPMNTSTGTTANAFKYTAKELSLFRGLPVYDYTARHTLPAAGNMFRTMDPFAEKYHGISPYTFCAGDPVNFTDPTGQIIQAELDGVMYKLQVLESGGYGFVDENGAIYQGNNELASQTISSINELSSSSTGIGLVNSMIESDKICTLSEGSENLTTLLGDGNSLISWNYLSAGELPSIDNEGNATYYSDPETSFVHELKHAWDIANDKFDKNTWYTTSEGYKVPEAEKSACATENMVRMEKGLPIRTHYGSYNIFYKGSDYSERRPDPRGLLDYKKYLNPQK